MYFYKYFSARGRETLSEILGVADPFGLDPAEMVESILAAGFMPAFDHPKEKPWRNIGTTSEVDRDGSIFLIAVSRVRRISLQEARQDAYSPIK